MDNKNLPFEGTEVNPDTVRDADEFPESPESSTPTGRPPAALVRRAMPSTVFDIAAEQQTDPVEITKRMELFLGALDGLFYKRVNPEDLIRFQTDAGVILRPGYQACLELQKIWGITIRVAGPFDARGIPDPGITTQDNGSILAEIWGHGYCARTGQVVEWVRGARHSSEPFIGRGTLVKRWEGQGENRKEVRVPVNPDLVLSDLKACAYTKMVTNIVTMLAGKKTISVEKILEFGIDIEKTRRGHGFGSSAERKEGAGPEASGADQPISEARARRMWAIAGTAAKSQGWNDSKRNAILTDMLKDKAIDVENLSLNDAIRAVKVKDYNGICEALEGFKK